MKRFVILPLFLVWFVGSPFVAGLGEVVNFSPCETFPGNCIVHEVRINPCAEAEEHQPCKVKRGKSASIEFDYTAQWDTERAHGQVFSVTDDGDLPMAGMNTNACDNTPCPIQNAVKQTYAYTLPLSKKFPVGTYTIKWIIRDGNQTKDDTTERCCFTTKIKLAK